MIDLWTAPDEYSTTRAVLYIPLRPKRQKPKVSVVYQDETHQWLVRVDRGVVTVFRRARGATRGGNAITLGSLERARVIIDRIRDVLYSLEVSRDGK
jgi:hypothetical protein